MTEKKPPFLRIVSAIDGAEVLSGSAPAAAAGGAQARSSAGRQERPRDVPPGDDAGGAGGEASGGDDLDLRLAQFPRTDLGNVQRFIARFGHQFLHVLEWGWLFWDGRRWRSKDADAYLQRCVYDTINAIRDEADALADSPLDFVVAVVKDENVWLSDKVEGWCLASQSLAHLKAVSILAAPLLSESSKKFDADPLAFNVENGTLRFRKREDAGYITFHPHDPADRITKIAPVSYDPDAKAERYDAFLARVQPDLDMRRHLHAWGGLSLTGTPIAKLSFWYGTGRNGKSTLIDAWAFVMGDYSQTIPIESFLDSGRSRKGGDASPDIAALPGVRCLRTSEPEKGAKLAESLVKLVTGGEPLRARHLNRDFFEFRPSFKLTMQGNYRPRIDGTDEGIWARILLVPWTVMIPADERDPYLGAKLQAEGSGILNRLLDGLADYLDHGLSPTKEVLDATADYRDDSDPIGRFINECILKVDPPAPDKPEDEMRVAGNEIYRLYIVWAKCNGERPWSARALSRGLQDHGIAKLKSSGVWYRHVRLIKSTVDFEGMSYVDEPRDD